MAPRKAKKDPKKAADDAEARAAGKKTSAKTTKAPKTGPAVAKAASNPDTDLEAKALFLQHLPKIAELKNKLNTANANLRNAYKTAKADGFQKDDFEVAFQIQGDGGEKKRKSIITRHLTIAKWLGCDLGAQLDLFVDDARVPAVDRAYEEGQSASMQGKPLKCDYHETTEQYRRFVQGFNDHQTTLQKGFKKLEPKEGENGAGYPTEPGNPKQPSNVVAAPTSGTPMTREEFKKMQSQQGQQPN